MIRRFTIALLLLLVIAAGVKAQAGTVDIRGQFLLPTGDPPREPLRFVLNSSDGRLTHDIRFSDSNGRFAMRDIPAGRSEISIFVQGDGSTFADTTYKFVPYETSFQGAEVRIILEPMRKVAADPLAVISAASGYKPLPEAAKAREAALQAIEKQQMEAAEKLLRRAIELDGKFSVAMTELAALLMQQKRYPEAEQFLRRSLEADPKSVLTLLNLGITLNRQAKFADAIPHLREAVRLEPRLVAAHLHLGIALLETGQHEEAERALQRATRAGGAEEILAQLHLGQLYAHTGAHAKAVAALEIYLEKAPSAANVDEVRSLIASMREKMNK